MSLNINNSSYNPSSLPSSFKKEYGNQILSKEFQSIINKQQRQDKIDLNDKDNKKQKIDNKTKAQLIFSAVVIAIGLISIYFLSRGRNKKEFNTSHSDVLDNTTDAFIATSAISEHNIDETILTDVTKGHLPNHSIDLVQGHDGVIHSPHILDVTDSGHHIEDAIGHIGNLF